MFRRLSALLIVLLTLVQLSNTTIAQESVGLTVFRDEDSLTLYVPGNQNISLQNLGFDVEINDNRYIILLQDYEAFRALYFTDIPTPICFRLERQGSQTPVPRACQGILLLTQRLADADVFWYDQVAKQERTFLVVSAPTTVGICPAGQTQCEMALTLPTVVPVTLVPPTPVTPALSVSTPIPAGTSNSIWEPIIQEFNGVPMVYVPAGCFMMGANNGQEAEQPVHEVCVDAFWISQTEITNAEYRVCVEAGACVRPRTTEFYNTPTYADHPVVNVDWYQSNAYALWMGGSLPSEAQWEYAARGPEGWIYPWGNSFDAAKLNFCDVRCESSGRDSTHDDGYATTAPVGTYHTGASWVGALDMAGNVWEWAADWEGKYSPGTQINPTGPSSGLYRIFRGGAWGHVSDVMRASFRGWYAPENHNIDLGFRIVVLELRE